MRDISIRLLWRFYKQVALERGNHDRHEFALMQHAFYCGARSVLMVLNRMIEDGELEVAGSAIQGMQRQTLALGSFPRPEQGNG